MFIFPEDKPVICGIRSKYVLPKKLLQYYLEHFPAGCVHFHSDNAECVLFFAAGLISASRFQSPDQNLEGESAIKYMSVLAGQDDFGIDVFEISPKQVELWGGLQHSEPIHSNLSTEFTDLQKLIGKLADEHLTGYIDIDLTGKGEQCRIFMADGGFLGGVYSWVGNKLSLDKEHFDNLVNKTATLEGIFNVYQIQTPSTSMAEAPEETPSKQGEAISQEGIQALEELLAITLSLAESKNDIGKNFHTLLKKKWIQNADQFPFLDPFAGEFSYQDGKIAFSGDVEGKLLATGLLVSIFDLMEDHKLMDSLSARLYDWQKKHATLLTQWSVTL